MRESSLLTWLLFPGKDRFSMDRCHYDTATTGRLDPSFGKACSWLFPYKRRPLDQLGRGNEGNNNLVFTKVNHGQHQFLYCQFSSEFSHLLLLYSHINVKYFNLYTGSLILGICCSLRKQPTFCDTATAFPAIWHLQKEHKFNTDDVSLPTG